MKRCLCKKITNISREKSNQWDGGNLMGDGSEMTVGYFMN